MFDKDIQCDGFMLVYVIVNEVEESKLILKFSIEENEKLDEVSELFVMFNVVNEYNKFVVCMGCISF